VRAVESTFLPAARTQEADATNRLEDEGRGMLVSRAFWLAGLLSLVIWTLIVLAWTRA
jgi:hypothetical protein